MALTKGITEKFDDDDRKNMGTETTFLLFTTRTTMVQTTWRRGRAWYKLLLLFSTFDHFFRFFFVDYFSGC